MPQKGLRRLAKISWTELRSALGADLVAAIEQNRRRSSATSRILRLNRGQRWPEDEMQDVQVIIASLLSIYHVTACFLRFASYLSIFFLIALPCTSSADSNTLLYSLQLIAGRKESTALNFIDTLPDALAKQVFRYTTDNDYYTVRIGTSENKNDLEQIKQQLDAYGYKYIIVKTSPKKLAATEGTQLPPELSPQTKESSPTVYENVIPPQHADNQKIYQPITSGIEATANSLSEIPSAPDIPSPTGTAQQESVPPSNEKILRLSLQDAVKLAMTDNRRIQVASYYPSIANEELKSARSVYDPVLFAENNIARTDRPTQSILDNGTFAKDKFLENRWDMRAGVKKPVPTGGMLSLYAEVDHLNSSSDLVEPNPQYTSRLTVQARQALLREFGDISNKSTIRKADQNIGISNAESQKTRGDVLLDVSTAYWNFAFFQNQYTINSNSLEAAEELYKRELSRNVNGLSTMLDVDKAFSEVKQRESKMIESKTQYLVAMDKLKLLLGVAPDSEYYSVAIEPTDNFSRSPVAFEKSALLAEALTNRPEVIITRKKRDIADIETTLAKHQQLPKLDATAKYTFNSLGTGFNGAVGDTYFSEDASWVVGLEFEYPIGGNNASAKYSKAQYEHRQAEAELDRIVEQITYEINSAFTEVAQSAEGIEAARIARDANKRVLERESARYELAKVGNQAILDAQKDFYESERNYLRANLNSELALLHLKWAAGSLHKEFGINP